MTASLLEHKLHADWVGLRVLIQTIFLGPFQRPNMYNTFPCTTAKNLADDSRATCESIGCH